MCDVVWAVALPPFQTLIDEHRDDLYRFLRASVGAHDADDCFQETFMAAMRAYPRLRPDSNLRAWVLTIAHRKALDTYRSKKRHAIPVEEVPEVAHHDPARPDGELWAQVRELPRKQRGAILLRYGADLSHAEIAVALDCSEEAARRSVHEGLKKLRAKVAA
jgi:RNA polymerase sigma factor (sigma-70 family)